MRIETREDALLWCFTLWMDMARTGGFIKFLSKVWKDNGGELESCCASCPVCQFGRRVSAKTLCNKQCIIKWGTQNGHCEGYGSAYSQWDKALTIKDRKKWALEIAILALEAL